MELISGFIGLPGGTEWIILVVVVAVLLGARNASNLIGTVTRGLREFTDAKREITKAIEDGVSDAVGDIIDPEKPKKRKRRPRALPDKSPKSPDRPE